MKHFLTLCAALSLTSLSAHATTSCPAPGAYTAVDLSMPVDQPYLDKLKELQIPTVIRYYDQVNETIPGKTISAAETDLIARNGFDLLVVFQHHNDKITSFTAARGKSDALRSIDLTAVTRQPAGSAVYYGVDGGWDSAKDLASIKTYFGQAAPITRAAGFKVGVYGSGLVCQQLMDDGLADFCWLSNARSWPGFDDFEKTMKWSLVQSPPRVCAGKEADFDFGNDVITDVGQFRPH